MTAKLIYSMLAALGLGGVGWYAYQHQQNPASPGFEVGQGRGSGAQSPGAAGQQGGGAPASGPGASGAPGGQRASGPPAGGPRGPVTVEVARVRKQALADEAVAVGSLRANESVTLRSEVSGRIQKIGFKDGARVQRGMVLIALDASVTAAEVEQARAEFSLAQANFERTSELAARNFVSQSAKDQSAANLKVLDARVRLAEARLAKSEIRAPFGGVMGLRNVSPGEFVREGADLAVIEDIASMKVDLRLPERYFGQVRPGQTVQLSVDSLPGKVFRATLQAIDAQIDANGRSLLARGTLPNPDGALRTGMFARARVVLRENPDALTVPEEAVIAQGTESLVWRIDAGKAQRVKIQTGLRRDGRVEIVSGLSAGDQVVTAGQLRLNRDGQEVRVADAPRVPGGPGQAPAAGPGAGPGAGTGAGQGAAQGAGQGAGPAAGPASAAPSSR